MNEYNNNWLHYLSRPLLKNYEIITDKKEKKNYDCQKHI